MISLSVVPIQKGFLGAIISQGHTAAHHHQLLVTAPTGIVDTSLLFAVSQLVRLRW